MARMVTKRMGDALRNGAPIALLAYIDHPAGAARYWTGLGTLEYDGSDWTGVGKLGAVTPVRFVSDLSIQEISFVLSGVDAADIAAWLQNNIRGREAQVWLAALTPELSVIADPLQIVDARLDYPKMPIDDEGNKTITLTAYSGFYTLERAIDEVHSAEDQHRRYPDDSGCDLITALQQQDVIWTPT